MTPALGNSMQCQGHDRAGFDAEAHLLKTEARFKLQDGDSVVKLVGPCLEVTVGNHNSEVLLDTVTSAAQL